MTGTTSSADTAAGRRTLSQARAGAVRDLLVGLGVDRLVITVRGTGSDGPSHITDRDAKGNLLPWPAARNHNVVLQSRAA